MVEIEGKKELSELVRSMNRKEHRYLGVGFIQPLEAGEWLEKTVFQRLPLPFVNSETSGGGGYMAYEAWFAGPEFKTVALVGIYSNEKVGTNISITVWALEEDMAERISGEMARALRPMVVFKPPVLEVKKSTEVEEEKGPTTGKEKEIIEELELEEDTSDPTKLKLKQLQKKWIAGVSGKDGEATVFEIGDENKADGQKEEGHEKKKKKKKIKKKKE